MHISAKKRAGRGRRGPRRWSRPGTSSATRREGLSGVARGRRTARAAGSSSRSVRVCCTLEDGAPAGRWRVFRMIPRFFLERRFSVDGLPCAEGAALHMGARSLEIDVLEESRSHAENSESTRGGDPLRCATPPHGPGRPVRAGWQQRWRAPPQSAREDPGPPGSGPPPRPPPGARTPRKTAPTAPTPTPGTPLPVRKVQ